MSGIRLEMDNSRMRAALIAAPVVVNKAIDIVLDRYATVVQDTARSNAPWNDQTGNARNGLNATRFSGDGERGIELAHSVPYGIYLETRWGGKYQIIMPTLEGALPEVLSAASKVLGAL